jgi:2-polyprenyl-3-methyl-5-hydroxy-6-metoxy-1,4-benzoquinol methylase
MQDYDKYKKEGDIHWKWYFTFKNSYKDLVDQALDPFRKVSKHNLGTLLEIGCGDGVALNFLSRSGFYCTGVEPVITATAFAEEHGVTAEYYNETVEEFVKRGLRFDYFFSLNVIEHVQKPEVFVELMRRVKYFGVIVTDRKQAHVDLSKYHMREYSPKEFEELFKDFDLTKLPLSNDAFFGYIIKNKTI